MNDIHIANAFFLGALPVIIITAHASMTRLGSHQPIAPNVTGGMRPYWLLTDFEL
ncbi:hypothetical protein OG21DRAFT_1509297 [Imleria badia]|nr:hypothetical protein OG21DRAFT_1509297 [Imleria badia]